ncbi:flavin monoamine oxidase family protein [Derxia lacustris]|uniref:flavin monoamine oxidase family protein n=1 Tax=Derxia lacustris TaxID=764842 RepID=UPI0015939636|nr:NAD(P)/FAD-dependent oxidoreductase [Derxia lacustris]
MGRTPKSELSIGIVGGGQAGMYAALLLDQLGIRHHIIEASGERVGGRVLTHYFDNAPHQYAELGAMRFPHSELQSRLFSFWQYLNETAGSVAGAREIVEIPYVLFDANPAADAGNLLCYNGRTPVTRNLAKADNSLLGFDQFFVGPEWDYFKADGKLKPAQQLLDSALERFNALLEAEGIDRAWAEILKYNGHSGRSYLIEIGDGVRPYPTPIVDYMETALTYTGMYGLSFIEMLLDHYSFDDTSTWSAMDGGTDRITQEMINRIPRERITLGAEVFKLEESGGKAVVHFRNGAGSLSQTLTFDRVIVTLPFNVLRGIETPASWSAGKYEAIRMLKMTNAVKIALGFRSRFWEQPGIYSSGMRGGQSNTDLPVRSVVYPSFGIGEPGPAYLLGSYCWENDADKFSHLNESAMFDLALRSVVHLHGAIAEQEYLGHGAAVVWNQRPLAGGGFAYFGPGQFGEKFLAGREPEGLFHFAGEHLDIVHYWIAGSYNSAFRTVWEALILENLDSRGNLETLFSALGGGKIFPSMIPQFGRHSLPEALALADSVQSAA